MNEQAPQSTTSHADALTYATVFSQWLSVNPFKAIAGNLVRDITILTTMHKKRELCQRKMDLLNSRIEKLEAQINRESAHDYGQRLNRLR